MRSLVERELRAAAPGYATGGLRQELASRPWTGR